MDDDLTMNKVMVEYEQKERNRNRKRNKNYCQLKNHKRRQGSINYYRYN